MGKDGSWLKVGVEVESRGLDGCGEGSPPLLVGDVLLRAKRHPREVSGKVPYG